MGVVFLIFYSNSCCSTSPCLALTVLFQSVMTTEHDEEKVLCSNSSDFEILITLESYSPKPTKLHLNF